VPLLEEIDANATLVAFPSRRGRPLRRFDPGEWSIGIEAAAGITKDRRSTAVQSADSTADSNVQD
jgi:hypothetical protein